VHKKIREVVSAGRLGAKPRETIVARALEGQHISSEEAALIERARAARDQVVQVDAFETQASGVSSHYS
jgi:hypothetical protein